MTAPRPPGLLRGSRLFWGIVIGMAVLVVILANAHLLHVANGSQPRCVEHVKGGDQDGRTGTFSAAKSSC